MTVEHVVQAKTHHRRPINPSESPDQEPGALTPRLKNPLIDKCLKQLVKKGLFGRPYVKDYLYDQKRRNCRPNTIRSNSGTLPAPGGEMGGIKSFPAQEGADLPGIG